MSPVTHFLTGWVFANGARLERRDRAIVTLACVVPDVDGLGIISELLTRNTSHPLLWFTLYHHALHTLAFAMVCAILAFGLAVERWKTAALALVSFHIHLFEDVIGSRGPDGYQWPMPYLAPFFIVGAARMARAMGAQRVAERGDHDRIASGDVVAGVGARVLSAGDDLTQGR